MARRKRPEEHDNHERWLVSYADFITLLFAFFVVMYALSTVNEGKYRILSDSMVSAFRNVQVNTSSSVVTPVVPPLVVIPKASPPPKAQELAKQKQRDKMRNVAKDILEVICRYVQIDPEMVTVQLEQKDGDISILELNVTLPEAEESKS